LPELVKYGSSGASSELIRGIPCERVVEPCCWMNKRFIGFRVRFVLTARGVPYNIPPPFFELPIIFLVGAKRLDLEI